MIEAMGPACETCLERGSCPNAQEGTFCTRWRGHEIPAERTEKESPADAWARGEDM